jgi:hypothetical protein
MDVYERQYEKLMNERKELTNKKNSNNNINDDEKVRLGKLS